jgi:hypothetical protein
MKKDLLEMVFYKWNAIYVILETIGVFCKVAAVSFGLTGTRRFDPGVRAHLGRRSWCGWRRAVAGGGLAGVRRHTMVIELVGELQNRVPELGLKRGLHLCEAKETTNKTRGFGAC